MRGACRYEPSCSNYALLAIDKYGAWKGSGMALRRIHRCRVPNGGEDYP
ncbi:membrane protein insertion efficiency factor YidD [Pseudomonas balearica]|nr:membrane protein insertion efficiency factor YidD [Stutzerimonas balearica]